MPIAKNIQDSLERSSWIRKMFETGAELKAKYGEENVFDFSIGNPDIPPPPEFFKILRKLASEDTGALHGYMPNAGFPETRRAVAGAASVELGVSLAEENIVMTCGAAGGINVILRAVLDPGDEVIVLKPYFVEYGFYIANHSGKTVLVDTNEDFSLNIKNIQKALTPRTKAIIINSPNNPTGKIYSREDLSGLAELLYSFEETEGKTVFIISDEPYRKIVYDGADVPCVLKEYRNSIIATSYSKTLSIPGERIGYIAVNPECSDFRMLMNGLVMCNRILGFVNAPALIQRVIAELGEVSVDVESYKRRRDHLMEGLGDSGYEFVKPDGAFYLFCRSPVPDDVEFVKHLQTYNILAVPGTGFGGPGYFRLSYTVPDRMIESSFRGFKEALRTFG